MAAKNVGTLIREGRTAAGLTQDQLAQRAGGLTAAEISKAERGEKELTQAQLKAIAKSLGVTQASLLNAPRGGVSSGSGGKTPSSSGNSGKTASSASASNTMKLSDAERKLIRLYRKASAEQKQAALAALEEQKPILDGVGGELLNGLMGILSGKK